MIDWLVVEMLTKLPLLHRIIGSLLGILFAWSAIMQTNDPDPGWWIVLYGLLAVACFVAALWRVVMPAVVVVGVLALVWSATLFPGVIELFTNREPMIRCNRGSFVSIATT